MLHKEADIFQKIYRLLNTTRQSYATQNIFNKFPETDALYGFRMPYEYLHHVAQYKCVQKSFRERLVLYKVFEYYTTIYVMTLVLY